MMLLNVARQLDELNLVLVIIYAMEHLVTEIVLFNQRYCDLVIANCTIIGKRKKLKNNINNLLI